MLWSVNYFLSLYSDVLNTPIILFQLTLQIIVKKREPLNFGIPDGSTGFSSRLAATQDMPFIHQSVSMCGI